MKIQVLRLSSPHDEALWVKEFESEDSSHHLRVIVGDFIVNINECDGGIGVSTASRHLLAVNPRADNYVCIVPRRNE